MKVGHKHVSRELNEDADALSKAGEQQLARQCLRIASDILAL